MRARPPETVDMNSVRRALAHLSDAGRVLAFIALRGASYLPRGWALAASDAIGWLYFISPLGSRVRQSMSNAFPLARHSDLAREWITRPFRDYLSMRRLAIGRDDAAKISVISRGEPKLLREPGQSMIIALGHFSREASIGLYKAGVAPKKLLATIAAPDRSPSPRAIRIRMQLSAISAGIKRARNDDVEIVAFDGPGAITRIAKHLKRPDTAVTISADAVLTERWKDGCERPFAGHSRESFAVGTARLCRLSQRPIIVCVPFLDEAGRTVLEWSEPIPPPARDDETADLRITNAVLDLLERAVGLRPGQYVLSIGDERRWDSASQCWLDRQGKSAFADPSPAFATERAPDRAPLAQDTE
jgi:lauroyl/myristoyl acyltransferase